MNKTNAYPIKKLVLGFIWIEIFEKTVNIISMNHIYIFDSRYFMKTAAQGKKKNLPTTKQIFTNSSQRVGCDTRSIFKWSLTNMNLVFFLLDRFG